ncbi:hypothetical protein [Glycomyces xiaoerkulensis]|uniref:hypothetical protein n=1 Tax=Glycomyces xiaoerkulensis TaxID=2038139 RepID=UPI000C257AF4|nr:hypothetical protein [Glycomyces xiaoerkulensis]
MRSRLAENNEALLEEFSVPWIQPGEEVYLGSVFPIPAAADVAALRLEIDEARHPDSIMLSPFEPGPAPELNVTDITPLFAPAGTRIEFEAEMPPEEYRWTAAVLFRDDTGDIVGGMTAAERPTWTDDRSAPLPGGHSVHHLYLPEYAIPDGADLDRVEVGPSPW